VPSCAGTKQPINISKYTINTSKQPINTLTACHPAQGDNNNNAGAAAAGNTAAAARINPEMAARRWTSLNLTRSDGGPKGLAGGCLGRFVPATEAARTAAGGDDASKIAAQAIGCGSTNYDRLVRPFEEWLRAGVYGGHGGHAI
jgi:hypothetical protein